MKRFTVVLLALIFVLSACGPAPGNNTNQAPVSNTQTNTQTDPQTNTVPLPSSNQTPNTDPQGNTNQSTNTNSHGNTNQAANTNSVPNTEDGQKKLQEQYDKIYASGILSSEDLKLFLDGSWSLIPYGSLPGTEPPFATLSFDKATSRAELTILAEDKPKVFMEFSSEHLFDMLYPSEDIIYLDVMDASEIIKKTSPLVLGTHNQFQILACRYKDDDIIALREVGNGTSNLAMEILTHDTMTQDGFWIFVRDGGTKSSVVINDAFDIAARYKNGTFYAFRWVNFYGSCYLVPANVEVYEDVFWVDKVSVLRYSYANNGRSLINVFYDVEGFDAAGHEGSINPQLVEITVDEAGQITELKEHLYYSYGVYSVDAGINEYEQDYRDPQIYGETDKTFLGKWYSTGGSGIVLEVSEASLQTGGYRFDIKFSGNDTAECYANISEEDLIVNQGYVNDSYDFECALIKKEGGIQLLVTSSKWDKMKSGDTIDFVRN